MGLASFWANSSQTHLVTLFGGVAQCNIATAH
jgi:hypothetical protein